MGLPRGVVTLVFTDIEGSTRLLRALGDDYAGLLDAHRGLIRAALAAHGGTEVNTEGDGFLLAFGSGGDAVNFCVDAQRLLAEATWPSGTIVRVRMGLHTGPVEVHDRDYVGLTVHQAARICAAAHGGQVVLSRATAEAAGLPDGTARVSARSLGRFALKDFDVPVELLQLMAPGLAADFSQPRAMPAAAHNVPLVATSFVGRTQELTEIPRVLAMHRVVTLAGPGGSGKTRLAFRVATDLAGTFAGGTWVVLLASLDNPSDLAGRVVQALGAPEQPGRDYADVLIDHVRDQELLLVLDNCEHLVTAVAELVARLVAACPGVRVLATSQEPLRLSGEFVWRLSPLRLPAAGEEVLLDRDAATSLDAVRLFAERAQLADPAFVLDEATTPLALAICRAVEGMPLAIELAAARLRHLRIQDLAARLGDRLRILTGGSRDLPTRQQALRNTIEWSYDLLSQQQRLLLCRLSVFRAPFDLAAAEAIGGFEPLESADVLDLLAELVDRSLLMIADVDAMLRYRMLATIADFAREQLDRSASEADEVRHRHAAYVLTSLQHLNEDGAAVEGLDPSATSLDDDVRAAVEWALARGDVDTAANITASWARCCFRTSRFSVPRALCDRVLDAEPARPLLLYGAGLLALCDADPEGARRRGQQLLALGQTVDDGPGIAGAHHILGDAAMMLGAKEDARRHYLEALAVAETDRAYLLRRTLISIDDTANVSDICWEFEEIIAGITELENRFEMARTYAEFAFVLIRRDDDRAIGALRRAWQIATELRFDGIAVAVLVIYAHLMARRDAWTEAASALALADWRAALGRTTARAAANDYHGLVQGFDWTVAAVQAAVPAESLATIRAAVRADPEDAVPISLRVVDAPTTGGSARR